MKVSSKLHHLIDEMGSILRAPDTIMGQAAGDGQIQLNKIYIGVNNFFKQLILKVEY